MENPFRKCFSIIILPDGNLNFYSKNYITSKKEFSITLSEKSHDEKFKFEQITARNI